MRSFCQSNMRWFPHILQASSHIHPVIAELFSNLHDLNSKWRWINVRGLASWCSSSFVLFLQIWDDCTHLEGTVKWAGGKLERGTEKTSCRFQKGEFSFFIVLSLSCGPAYSSSSSSSTAPPERGAVSRPKLLRVENSWRQNPIFVFVLHPLENEISSSLRVKPKIKQTLNSQI